MDLRSLSAQVAADRLRSLARGTPLPTWATGATLLADIAGFTPLTNALTRIRGPRRGAEELSRHLNVVYGALITEIDRYGGSVVDFSGDAINCWFGDDAPAGNGSRRAITAGLALQEAMCGIRELVVPDGPTVKMGLKVGIAAGRVRAIRGRRPFGAPDRCLGRRRGSADRTRRTGGNRGRDRRGPLSVGRAR